LTALARSRHSRAFLPESTTTIMSQPHRTATKQARRKRYLKRKKAADKVAKKK
jgi:hypothetical protein